MDRYVSHRTHPDHPNVLVLLLLVHQGGPGPQEAHLRRGPRVR